MKTAIMTAVIAILASNENGVFIPISTEEYLFGTSLMLSSHDNLDDEDMEPEPPFNKRDAIKKFFPGTTQTNALINEIIQAYSNNMDWALSGDDHKDRIAGMSLCVLGEIDHPLARDFLAYTLTNDTRIAGYAYSATMSVFRYSNFEPEVMNFMRNICVNTNVYDGLGFSVAHNMINCTTNLPESVRGNATTNIAKFLHYSVRHITKSIASTESELVGLFPEYLDSIQRLQNIQYIANTATNVLEREWAIRERDRMTAMPTNELNNLTWLLEDFR